MKKPLKIFFLGLLLLVVGLVFTPLLFKEAIQEKVLRMVNDQLNAQVHFRELNISLVRSFPKASLLLRDFSIVNKAPFEGDTLVHVEKMELAFSVDELFGQNKPIRIQKIGIDRAVVSIKIDSLGSTNTDIVKSQPETSREASNQSGDFSFDLNLYQVKNSQILFKDDLSKMSFQLLDFDHKGKGSWSGEKIILDTETFSNTTLSYEGKNYLNKDLLELKARIAIDMDQQHYALKENRLLINDLALEFAGFAQILDTYTQVDLSFKTPNTDFENFLALIPSDYIQHLQGVETEGDFSIAGSLQGKIDDDHIPAFDVKIVSENASFKYTDLPKKVENIFIDTEIKNETGLIDDTYIQTNSLNFTIDKDVFGAKGTVRNLMQNPTLDLVLKGVLNLSNLSEAYPMPFDYPVRGILSADLETRFDMNSIEKEQYQNIESSGIFRLSKFKYNDQELPNPIHIDDAELDFNSKTIELKHMRLTTGRSDLNASGSIDNFLGFLFTEQDLKGDFDVTATSFDVADFMIEDQASDSDNDIQETTAPIELKIPDFLDATLRFAATEIHYDNITLQNTIGVVKIANQTAHLQQLTAGVFGGNIGLDGSVSTQSSPTVFDLAMKLTDVDIARSFEGMKLIQELAPITQALTGNLSTQMNLRGALKDQLSIDLKSLRGTALAEIVKARVSSEKAPLLTNLNNQLDFVQMDQLKLKDVKTDLNFENGNISVKPFTFQLDDITVTAGGDHGFDRQMDYKVNLDIPAKYLARKSSGLASQSDIRDMKVDLPIGLTGTFANPKIDLDMGMAVKQLAQQAVRKKKNQVQEKLLGKGRKALEGILPTSKTKSDSLTKTDQSKKSVEQAAKGILGGLLGNKKKKDSTQRKNQ